MGFLASLGVVVSTALVGVFMYTVFAALGHGSPLVWCLMFGALISPTDPISVMAILKHAKAEKSLEMKLAGESLLNDGFAVVLFVLLLGIAVGHVQDVHRSPFLALGRVRRGQHQVVLIQVGLAREVAGAHFGGVVLPFHHGRVPLAHALRLARPGRVREPGKQGVELLRGRLERLGESIRGCPRHVP